MKKKQSKQPLKQNAIIHNHYESDINKEISFEYLKYCHQCIDATKLNVYSRASIIILIITFILPQGIEIFRYVFEIMLKDSNEVGILISIIIGFFFFITHFFSIIYIFHSLSPFKSRNSLFNILDKQEKEFSKNDQRKKDVISAFTAFPHITSISREQFRNEATKLDYAAVYEQLVQAIYTLSQLTEKRYYTLKKAYSYLFLSFVAYFILFIFWLLIGIPLQTVIGCFIH